MGEDVSVKEVPLRQRQALEYLALEGSSGVTVRGFAEFAGLTRDSASGTLQRMAKAGLCFKEATHAGQETKFYAAVPTSAHAAPQATEAYDKGWMDGYEKGRAAGLKERLEPDLALSFKQGRAEGVIAGKRSVGLEVLTLVSRMQQEMREGAPVHIHSTTCWTKNYACALNSVRKLVERETGLKEIA